MTPLELLNKHCVFSDDYECYVILTVSRKKDTPEITNSQEIVFRDVIKRKEDINRKYHKIKASIVNYRDENDKNFPFYVYVSANSRDSRKATFSLINRINHWFQEELNGVNKSKMFKRIHGYFYSELMKKENRGKTRQFLIDYDAKDKLKELKQRINNYGGDIILTQETRNGYHIITTPFDRNKWNNSGNNEYYDCEIKTDANLFVEYVKLTETPKGI